MLNVQINPSKESGTKALLRLGKVRKRNLENASIPSTSAASYMSFGNACRAPDIDIIMNGIPNQIFTKITTIRAPFASANKFKLVPKKSFNAPAGSYNPLQTNTEMYDGIAQGRRRAVR